MQTLESYVAGRWEAGDGEPQSLKNPATGDVLAVSRAGGTDFDAVLEYARTRGGPALRALSFAERAQILKRLSSLLHERREELLDLAVANGGNTRGDAKFDVDGAIGTLAAYAELGASLGERSFLPDGPLVSLGRSSRFSGQHLLVSRHGVAVHVNAFNFPAWGMMEKAACAWLAGVPVISKPATSTALLAWRIARIVVEAEVLPEGAFQLVLERPGGLLERLGPQDCVAFTGSSDTGAWLKGLDRLVQSNVRINIEADSLNAAVLAPDVEAGSETYGLFLKNVVLDMTQKAGQKCTAVRRILVPSERADEVQTDLVAELERTVVGDPAARESRMGPVTGASQLEDVREGIRLLSQVSEVVSGGPSELGSAGSFVRPTLLRARDPRAEAVHGREVFGPVATLLEYSGDADEAVELVALGGGGLVASVYSNDADWTERFVLGAAPWHGRIWIGSDRSAEQALPPGMVMPTLVHGGPGRAGGGEELGGTRGLSFYMQRVAVQGFKGLLETRFGQP